jgi:hypothetical protein
MDLTPDEARAAARAANVAGRPDEAYRLLLPLAEAGSHEIQSVLGEFIISGLHRSEGWDGVDEATARADLDRAGRFLLAASGAGIGPASFNLATLFIMGYGGGSWEERRARAAELYALSHTQGFTAFGGLMLGEGPGEPYLSMLERYASSAGCLLPGESEPGD